MLILHKVFAYRLTCDFTKTTWDCMDLRLCLICDIKSEVDAIGGVVRGGALHCSLVNAKYWEMLGDD